MRYKALIIRATLVALCCVSFGACAQDDDADGELRSGRKPKLSDKGLEARDFPAQATEGQGFVELSPSETGISFRNDVVEDRLILSNYTMASGLASADLNGDGLLDLYFCGINSPNRLYRNDGNMRFTEVTSEAGSFLACEDAYSMSAAFVDVNGDNILDLYVCHRNKPNSCFLGKGGFSFAEDSAAALGLDCAEPSTVAAFLDIDNDGDLDIFVMNYGPDPLNFKEWVTKRMARGDLSSDEQAQLLKVMVQNKIAPEDLPEEARDKFYVSPYGRVYGIAPPTVLLVNDGKGKFSEQTRRAGLLFNTWGHAAHATDLNNDGWIDLYLACDYEVNDKMFINNKDGTFTDYASEYMRKVPWYSMGVDSRDINGDGLPDLMTSDMLSPDYKRAKRQSGDMYDGRDELLYDDPQPQMRNMLYLSRGGGWLTEMGQYAGVAATEWTWSVRFADFNSNGLTELYASNGALVDVFDVDGRQQRSKLELTPGGQSLTLALVKQMEPYWTDDFIFELDPNDPFKYNRTENNWGMHDGSMGCGASLADYDGDGDVDIILNNTNQEAGVWRNDLPQGNKVIFEFKQDKPNAMAVGTRIWLYLGDKILMDDVIISRGYATGESGQLHFGVGDAATIDRVVVRWPDLSVQEYENLATNKHYTVTKQKNPARWPPEVPKTWFQQRDFPFEQRELDTQAVEFEREPLLPVECSRLGTGAGLADYDGDGKLDVYFAGAAGQSGALLRGDGNGGFSPSTSFKPPFVDAAEEMAVLWFDADGDGRLDLLVTAGGMEGTNPSEHYGARLLLNKTEGFVAAPLPARTLSTGSAAAVDIDNDGDLDLLLCGHIVAYKFMASVDSAVWLNDGKGGFTDATASYLAEINRGLPIFEAQFADMNRDGWQDLVLARHFGKVELWHGSASGFSKAADLTDSGLWRSLAVADLNNDGHLDLVAGNLGKNTKYSPKAGSPMQIYAFDFDGNGTRDLIEVKFAKIDGQVCAMPGRGRSCSGYAISYIPQKWPTWANFADATLEEVYGPGLAKAELFEANVVTSVVLISDGQGGFNESVLPRTSQLAPVFGIAAQDFDGDGNLDLFLGNNFARSQPEAGNWQTGYGVLLLGDGKGGFRDLEPSESGLYLSRDNRSVLAADLNGDHWPDLAVSMSAATARMGLRSEHQRDGKPLMVTLAGPAGNAAGVGAVLTLKLEDGRSLLRAVQCGQGFLGSYAGPVHFAYPSDSKPAELSVLWPDGSLSSTREVSERVQLSYKDAASGR